MSNRKKPANGVRGPCDRPQHNVLDLICEQWNLESATECLPHLLRSEGEADTWSPDLVHHLAQFAITTRNERADAVKDLLEIWQLRLRRFPESNPDICATNVEFVNRRWKLAGKALKENWTREERKARIPTLDAFPSLPKWKKRKGDFIDHVESREENGKEKERDPFASKHRPQVRDQGTSLPTLLSNALLGMSSLPWISHLYPITFRQRKE